MGIFDDIKKALGAAGGKPGTPAGARPGSKPRAPHEEALAAAQGKRRAAGVTRASGKRASRGKTGGYEHLERQVMLATGKFPWTSNEVRDALRAKGFDPDHVEAYLRSPAARKLLE